MTDFRDAAAVLEAEADDQRPMLADAMRIGAWACRDFEAQRAQVGKLLALLGMPCLKAAIARLEGGSCQKDKE